MQETNPPSVRSHLQNEVADSITTRALGLVESRHPRVDHILLEVSNILRGAVVVDAVDQLSAAQRAETPEDTVGETRRADGTAVENKRVMEAARQRTM